MKLNKANIFNLIFTILFFTFNILITYNANIDYKLWLIPGLAICGFALFSKKGKGASFEELSLSLP